MNYQNPYAVINGPIKKLYVEVPLDVYNAIKSPRVSSGTISTTLAILIQKLKNELERRNITTYVDQQRYESFVAGCVLTEGAALSESHSIVESDSRTGPTGSTVGIPDGQTTSPHVGRGVAEPSRDVAEPTQERSDYAGGTGVGGRGRRGKKKAA